jgi:rhodanese-related sulfurtransferase
MGCAKQDAKADVNVGDSVNAAGRFALSGGAPRAADTAAVLEGYRRISAREAKKMLDENAGAVLLDVRTADEFSRGRISGSVLLPVDRIDAGAAVVLTDKGALILIYCRRGNRSRVAANALIAKGYTNVYDFGGIDRWPYGTVKD